MSNDARTLYLLLSITFLAFLSTVFLPVSENYSVALFATISLPVVYSARYFSKKTTEVEEFRFFRKVGKQEEIIRDLTAVSTAYIVGYLVYMATSADFSAGGIYLYSVAFFIVLMLRYLIAIWYATSKKALDPDNPLVIVVVSFVFAVAGFILESALFVWWGVTPI